MFTLFELLVLALLLITSLASLYGLYHQWVVATFVLESERIRLQALLSELERHKKTALDLRKQMESSGDHDE